MTAPRILLVTGSRALVDSEYESDAVNVIRALVFALPSLAFVVAGDATGPDAWAIDAATSSLLSLEPRCYSCDGRVYLDRKRTKPRRRWSPTPAHPLVRNAAMVREVAEHARDTGARVRVLALEAAWSETKGTTHTVRLAEEAGFEVTRVTFARGPNQ
jgi:hypothetical protein